MVRSGLEFLFSLFRVTCLCTCHVFLRHIVIETNLQTKWTSSKPKPKFCRKIQSLLPPRKDDKIWPLFAFCRAGGTEGSRGYVPSQILAESEMKTFRSNYRLLIFLYPPTPPDFQLFPHPLSCWNVCVNGLLDKHLWEEIAFPTETEIMWDELEK